jgi:hypothetical protein
MQMFDIIENKKVLKYLISILKISKTVQNS